ncbi:MAG: TspO/MBR family protein [Chloroflexota bacterium]
MQSDKLRQTLTVLSFLLTMTVNTAANALPINGQMTGAISDRFHVFVIPAGYVFAIWGLIYVLLGAFTTWQALPRNREDETLRRLGYLPALSGVFNSVWILLFQYELFLATVPVIVALLVTLIAIHLRLWEHRDRLRGTTYWTVRAPFSVYLGWVTVATIANTAQTGSSIGFTGFGIEPALIAAAVLLVGLAIAATFVSMFRDVAYGLVIVWAYVGVMVKEHDTTPVLVAAGLGATVVAILVAGSWIRNRAAGAGRQATASATA